MIHFQFKDFDKHKKYEYLEIRVVPYWKHIRIKFSPYITDVQVTIQALRVPRKISLFLRFTYFPSQFSYVTSRFKLDIHLPSANVTGARTVDFVRYW